MYTEIILINSTEANLHQPALVGQMVKNLGQLAYNFVDLLQVNASENYKMQSQVLKPWVSNQTVR